MLVCVYGTLRAGCGNHRLLAGADFLGEVRLSGWDMYSFGGFPGVIRGDGEIVAEVYEVNRATMARLDQLEGYPGWYSRSKIPAVINGRGAWIYHFESVADVDGRRRVASGDWKCA